jgi:membrane-associated phospholipid phosphatase
LSLLVPVQTVVCLLPIWLATWIGLTRIVDYWHNFDDVSIGALLGFSIASLTFQLHVSTDTGDAAQRTGAAATAG